MRVNQLTAALLEQRNKKAQEKSEFINRCKRLYYDEELTVVEVMERTGQSIKRVRSAIGLLP